MSELVLQLMLLQVGAPLLLILLNALIPAASIWGLGVRSIAVAALILYVALAGVWLYPPTWTPYLLLGLHAIGVGAAFHWMRRRGGTARLPVQALESAAGMILLICAGVLVYPALAGRAAPQVAIDLAMPLGPGTYQVVSGGSTEAVNSHLTLRNVERARDYWGQNYAVDIAAVDSLGFHSTGIAPRDPRAYHIFGRDVLAPCAGEIVLVIDGNPDMEVPTPDRENMVGNAVMIACDRAHVLLAHLAPNSIAVSLGDDVTIGDPIGQVGNTGNTNEPHLHIHAQSTMPEAAPVSGEPLWFTIEGQFLVRNQIITGEQP